VAGRRARSAHHLLHLAMPLIRRTHSNERGAVAAGELPVMEMDEKERRRRAMMGGGGGKMSATVSTMQTQQLGGDAVSALCHGQRCALRRGMLAGYGGALTNARWQLNGENQTMQMMRHAVRKKMMEESASQKKLAFHGAAEESAPAKVAPVDPKAAFKRRSFSSSMPAHVMRKDSESLGDIKAMGNIVRGLDELADADSVSAMRYIQFTCEKLGLDAKSLPCAQKIVSAEASLKGTFDIVEEEEDELSLDDMAQQ
jgi:hypothetical protein